MIGLIDYDLLIRKSVYPNLEIMKLSSFYKQQREQVELIRDCREFMSYSKIYLRMDSKGDLPDQLLAQSRGRIEIGGRRIYSDKYKPLPAEIEQATPDTFIYSPKWILKKIDKTKDSFRKALKNFTGVRTTTCDLNKIYSEKQRYLIYDYNVGNNLEDFRNFMIKVSSTGVKKIHFVNRIIVPTYSQFEEISKWKNLISGETVIECLTRPRENEIKVPELKMKYIVPAFDTIYNSVDFKTGCDIINQNLPWIIYLRKECGFFLKSQFKNHNLNIIISYINGDCKFKNIILNNPSIPLPIKYLIEKGVI